MAPAAQTCHIYCAVASASALHSHSFIFFASADFPLQTLILQTLALHPSSAFSYDFGVLRDCFTILSVTFLLLLIANHHGLSQRAGASGV